MKPNNRYIGRSIEKYGSGYSSTAFHPLNKLVKPTHTSPYHSTPNHPGECGGSVVECRTPEREVRGSRPTAAVLCPWARHFTPRKYWLITQEAMAPSRHDWKIVDWDVKPQHNQPNHHPDTPPHPTPTPQLPTLLQPNLTLATYPISPIPSSPHHKLLLPQPMFGIKWKVSMGNSQ